MIKPRYIRGRLGGAKGGGVQAPTSAAVPVPPGSPLWFFDLTDTDTLFQDATAETPVTAADQNVGAVVSKGSEAMVLSQETADQQPTTEATSGVVAAAGYATLWTDFEGNDALSGAMETAPALPWTWAIVFDQETNSLPDVIMIAPDDYTGMAWATLNGTTLRTLSGSHFVDEATDYTQGALTAVIYTGSETEYSVLGSYSETPDAGDADGGSIEVDEVLHLGAEDDAGGTGMQGPVLELIVWNSELSGAEIAAYQTYVTAKYGITWT